MCVDLVYTHAGYALHCAISILMVTLRATQQHEPSSLTMCKREREVAVEADGCASRFIGYLRSA